MLDDGAAVSLRPAGAMAALLLDAIAAETHEMPQQEGSVAEILLAAQFEDEYASEIRSVARGRHQPFLKEDGTMFDDARAPPRCSWRSSRAAAGLSSAFLARILKTAARSSPSSWGRGSWTTEIRFSSLRHWPPRMLSRASGCLLLSALLLGW